MQKSFKFIFTFFLILCLCCLKAQSPEIDSLLNILKISKEDTSKVNVLNQLADSYWKKDMLDKSFSSCQNALSLSEKIGFKSGSVNAYLNFAKVYDEQGEVIRCIENGQKALSIAYSINDKSLIYSSLNRIGISYYFESDYSQALSYFLKALKVGENIVDKKELGKTASYLGLIYFNQGNYPKALEYDFKAIKYNEECDYKKGIASAYTNIGVIYDAQKNSDKALESYLKALKIAEEIDYKKAVSFSLINISGIYQIRGELSKALEYLKRALKIFEEKNDKSGIAATLNNIGALYEDEYKVAKKHSDKTTDSLLLLTFEYFNKSLAIHREIENKEGIAMVQANIGNVFLNEKKYDDAIRCCFESLTIAKEIDGLDQIKITEKILADIYHQKKDVANELLHYQAYIAARDSLFNAENTEKFVRTEMNFDFEKKQALEELEQEKKDAVSLANLNRQKIISYSVVGGLVVVLFFSVLLFNRFRLIRRQKAIIELQKMMVDEKNKEITDSIHYAKRIQQALLASDTLLKKNLPDFFIYYKPKDIVSGDFYWAQNVSSTSGNSRFILATADCTGHGVPGAFMSLLNISKLSDTINEKKIISPDLILNDVREEIIKVLNPEGAEVKSKDGMDCVLCSFDFNAMKLDVALANNPLWLVRDKKLIEYKPDKMPVGMYFENVNSFNLQTIKLQKGDIVYAFTDGYADQFGGTKGKKFKYKKLQELLLSISEKSMEEQRKELNEELINWKGNLEQVDDILVIGIRI